jgi:hypothetical protein
MVRQTLRFSLKTLLVSTLVFCLGLSLWIAHGKLYRSTIELRRSRSELGYVNVDDPEKINFTSVPLSEPLKWRWRVRLPEGRKYQLNFATIDIASSGLPHPWATFFVDGTQEFSITVDCHRDHLQEWKITALSTFGRGHSQAIGPLVASHKSWLEGQQTYSSMLNGKGATISEDPENAAELLRLRILDTNGVETNDGVLVWIAEGAL